MEYFSFRIHQGSVVSLLSQMLMKACIHLGFHTQRESLVSMCRTSAIDCVQAYIDMQSFSVVPTRTWSLTFNALSAALLLGALSGDDDDGEKVRELLGTLLDVLQGSEEHDDDDSHSHGHLTWLSRYTQALVVLRDMSAGRLMGSRNGTSDEDDKNGEADMDRDRAVDGEHVAQRSKLDVFLDPAALWKTYFSNLAATNEAGPKVLPQQVLFGV